MPKTADYLYACRGTYDREPHRVCWVRVFEETEQTRVIVMGELPQNTSTSVINMAEYVAPELIQRHFPAALLGATAGDLSGALRRGAHTRGTARP
jgi:hypothetical protein